MRASRSRWRRFSGILLLAVAAVMAVMASGQVTGGSQPPVTAPAVPVTAPSPRSTAPPVTLSARPTPTPSVEKRSGQPVRIVIPGLLSAPVVPIPLDAHELVPPDDPAVVGWFPFYKPGQAGTVVLAAHATSATSVGALEYIDKLRPGNVIAVEVKGGSVFRYRVSDVFAAVTKARSARLSSRMFSDHSGELVLVTSALYDPVTGKWNGNDVVFAALIG